MIPSRNRCQVCGTVFVVESLARDCERLHEFEVR